MAYSSQPRVRSSRLLAGVPTATSALMALASVASAQSVLRNNTVANLETTGAWTGGAVPGATDIASWNSSSAGGTQTLNGVATWGGVFINAQTPSSLTFAGNGSILSLGASGIDLNGGNPTNRGLTIQATVPVDLVSNQTWALGSGTTSAASITAANVISGSGTLTLTRSLGGLGQFQFNGASTYSGGTVIGANARVLLGTNSVASGSTVTSGPLGVGNVTINDGAFIGSSSTAGRELYLGTNSQFAGDFTVGQSGTNSGRIRFNGNIDLLGATRTITLGATATGTGASVGFLALGSLTTSNISNGTLRFVGTAAPSPIQFSAANVAAFTNNAGLTLGANTTTILGSGTVFGSAADKFPNLTIETGGQLDLSDKGANSRNLSVASLAGGGQVINGTTLAGTAVLTVNGTAATALSSTFSGSIQDGATGKVGLTKTGSTTLTLSGPNSYTAATTITGGTLALSGSGTLGNSATTVNGGTLDLGSTSTNVQSLTVSSGSVLNGSLSTASGVTYSGGTLSGVTFSGAGGFIKNGTGSLTLAGAHTYLGNTDVNAGTLVLNGSLTSNINLNAATLSGEGSTTGQLSANVGSQILFDPATPGSLTVGSVSAGAGTITVTPVGALSGSNIVVLESTANLTGTSPFILPTRGSLSLSANQKQLLATVPAPGDITLKWVGGDASNPTFWDSNATANFADGATSSKFFAGDNALFDDTAASFTVAIQSPGVSPTQTTFDNSTNDYTVTGGPIATGSLVKNGSALVVLSGNHTYPSGTTISAGTLQVGTGTTTGSLGTGAVSNAGTLILNRSNTFVQGTDFGTLSGAGSIQKTGTGGLTLTTANSHTGPLLIQNGGTLTVGDSAALGSALAGTTIGGTSSIQLNAGVNVAAEPLFISGWGSFGVIRFTSSGATWGGPIQIDNTNPVFGTPGELPNRYVRLGSSTGGGGTLTLSGPISGGNTTDLFRGTSGFGPTLAVRVANSATDVIVLSGASNFVGDFSVINGRVVLDGGDNRLPSTARYLGSWPGATYGILDLNGNDQTVAGISDWDTNGGTGEVTNMAPFLSVFTIDTADTQASIDATRNPAIHASPYPTPTYSGAIKGNIALVKQGTGDTTLAGLNTYTGDTTVNGGTLTLKQATLADGADVRIGGGKLILDFLSQDEVRALYINGVQQPAGIYGSTASGAANINDTAFGGTGTLKVNEGPANPFGAWAGTFGLTGDAALADADPDNDSVTNLVEWILGGTPNVSDTRVASLQITADATNLYVTFSRADASEAVTTLAINWGGLPLTGTTSVGATSSGPDANDVTVTVTENGASPDTVVVTIPRSNAVTGRLFARLQATLN